MHCDLPRTYCKSQSKVTPEAQCNVHSELRGLPARHETIIVHVCSVRLGHPEVTSRSEHEFQRHTNDTHAHAHAAYAYQGAQDGAQSYLLAELGFHCSGTILRPGCFGCVAAQVSHVSAGDQQDPTGFDSLQHASTATMCMREEAHLGQA